MSMCEVVVQFRDQQVAMPGRECNVLKSEGNQESRATAIVFCDPMRNNSRFAWFPTDGHTMPPEGASFSALPVTGKNIDGMETYACVPNGVPAMFGKVLKAVAYV